MSQRSGKLLLDRASVTRILTAAETLALNTTAIELVGSPGAGRAIVPHEAFLSKPSGTAGTGGGNVEIRLGTSGVSGMSATRAQTFPAGAAQRHLAPNSGAGDDNAALNIGMATGDMAANTSALTVTVLYSIVEL